MKRIVITVNEDGYLARCPGIQGAFAEGDTIEESIFNCADVLKMIIRTRSGKIRYNIISGEIIRIGEVQCLLVIGHDITEQKQTEDVLQQKETDLLEIQQIGKIAGFNWNLKDDNARWTPEFFNILELEPESFPHTGEFYLTMLVHPEDRTALRQTISEALKGKVRPYSEYRLIMPDGRIKHVVSQGKIICDDNDVPERMIGFHQDITDRKNAEAAFRENEAVLERIFETTHFLLAYLDRDFNFIRVNRAYANAAGGVPEDYIGKNHFTLYPHPENEAIFQSVVKSGDLFSIRAKAFEYPDRPERGTTYWDWTLSPVKDEKGQVVGLNSTLPREIERRCFPLSKISIPITRTRQEFWNKW